MKTRSDWEEVFKNRSKKELDDAFYALVEIRRKKAMNLMHSFNIGEKVEVIKDGVLEFKGEVTDIRNKRCTVKDDKSGRKYNVPAELLRRCD